MNISSEEHNLLEVQSMKQAIRFILHFYKVLGYLCIL